MYNDQRLLRAQASHPTVSPENPVLAGGPFRGRTPFFLSFCYTVQAAEYVRDNPSLVQERNVKPSSEFASLDFSAYCPEFNHIVAMQFAHTTHIPEMVQVVFYAMVISDATRLQLIRREAGESLMSDLQKLR